MKKKHLRFGRRSAIWAASASAAAMLVLGASGTLSSWTQAVLGNSSNTAATAKAVILKEANSAGTVTCFSSVNPTNSSTCATIDKYGGTTTLLTPGGPAQTTTVTFTNVGSANGTSFALAPGSCTQTPTAGSGAPPAGNVCSSGDVTVAVSCSPGATYSLGTAWSDLAYAAAAPPSATRTHTAASGDLNAGASWTCQFTVALIGAASPVDQNIQISQPLTWTLNG